MTDITNLCDYTDDDIGPLLARYGARPIKEAPRDGRLLRIIADYGTNNTMTKFALENTARYGWTIGFFDGDDAWTIAGWDRDGDTFTATGVTDEFYDDPVAFLPFLPEEDAVKAPQPDPMKALRRLSEWVEMEKAKIGAVDGYDYNSGEEFGLRRVLCEIDRRLAAGAQS